MAASIKISDGVYRLLELAAKEHQVSKEYFVEEAVDLLVSQLEYEESVNWEALETIKEHASEEDVDNVINEKT